ncbi:MAG TPA: hypothetical protein VM869_35460, partial [Enhygromyxa sp.]|nr:hypothetical protein [Enhygromyxa sp.]
PATSLIAVATTSASEAQPCERVCGSLGDCLLADDAYTITAAGGLELQCLDLCVHSADAAPAKTEFLACGAQTECGPLQACAEQHWTALAAAREGPAVEGVVAPDANPCKLGCRWLYSCLYSGAPPGEAAFDPTFEQPATDCVNQCDQMSETDQEYFRTLYGCLINRCSTPDGVYQCIEEAMSRHSH